MDELSSVVHMFESGKTIDVRYFEVLRVYLNRGSHCKICLFTELWESHTEPVEPGAKDRCAQAI